jgi:magnesium transporter
MALAQTGVQQNHDMRRISAAAALIAVPVAVAGVYGMNFDHMPELRQHFGYPVMLISTAVLVTVVYLAFRRKHWL